VATTNRDFRVKNGLAIEGDAVATGTLSAIKLIGTTVGGDEGGEILLGKPTTNTNLAGTGVTIDVYQNKLRFFEQGGDARGYYIDITGGSAGVGSNLASGGGGATTLDGLTDVAITTPATNSFLQYSGTEWIDSGQTLTLSGNTTIGSSTHTVAFATSGNTSVTLPTSGTLLTTAGSGSSLTFGTGSLSLAGNLTTSGAFTTTLTVTGNTSVTLPTSGTLITSAVTSLASITSMSTGTGAFTLAIANGATTNGTTKTINIGGSGVSGSTTNINLGSAVSGATSTINLNGTVNIATLDLSTAATSTAATSYWVETGSDGIVRPKTLANVQSEIVTTSTVNSAAATTVGIISSGTWNGTVINSTYGGTGVNNGGRTITLNTGNITFTANAAGSSVTVPQTGTLATTSDLSSYLTTSTAASTYAALVGATFTGTVIAPAATTSISSIRIPHGTEPTAPTNGDIWTTTAGMYARINGVTVGPFASDTDTNTTYDLTTSGTTTTTISLVGTNSTTDSFTITGSGATSVSHSAGAITISSTDTNTTYSQAAVTTTGGAFLRLTGSDTTNDDVKFAGSGATTVTYTDANTITISSTDTDTTYGIATSTVAGLVELFSDTTQTEAAQTVTSTSSRTYGIQKNANDQLVVNVPWTDTDTNTTYTFASGTTNGAFSVTPSGGSAQSVSIYGLGSMAYATTTDYAALAGATFTGSVALNGGFSVDSTAFSVADTTGNTSIAGTLAVTGNTTLTGDLAVNGGDLTTTSATATLFNTNATTLNIGGAATTVSFGAATGTTTINNNLSVTGTITGSPATPGNTTSADSVGYVGMPQVTNPASPYGITAADAGKHIYMTTTGRTITIPANSATPLEVGTTIVVINGNSVSTTINITTDTLRLANSSSTGTRTLASNGMCTLVKVASTEWIASGTGLS